MIRTLGIARTPAVETLVIWSARAGVPRAVFATLYFVLSSVLSFVLSFFSSISVSWRIEPLSQCALLTPSFLYPDSRDVRWPCVVDPIPPGFIAVLTGVSFVAALVSRRW